MTVAKGNESSIIEKLRGTLGEHRQSGNHLVFETCPLCHDTGYHFYLDETTGAFYCFKCLSPHGGGPFTLAKRLGLQFDYNTDYQKIQEMKELAAAWFADLLRDDPLAADVREWLKERCLDDKWLSSFQTGVDRIKKRLPIGFYPGSSRVLKHFEGLGYTGRDVKAAELLPKKMNDTGYLVFTYHVRPGVVGKFKLRKSRTKEFFWLSDSGQNCGAFGLNLYDWKGKEEAVGVEGEFDCLSMQLWKLEQSGATLNVVGLSGGAGKSAIRTLHTTGIRKLRVIPDNDNGGVDDLCVYARECRRHNMSCVVHSIPAEYEDPDEWVRSGDVNLQVLFSNQFLPGEYIAKNLELDEEFKQLDLDIPEGLQDARRYVAEKALRLESIDLLDFVRALPENLRPNVSAVKWAQIRSKARNAAERKHLISESVYQELLDRGEFIRTDFDYFYFMRDQKKVVSLGNMDFIALLNEPHGLVENEAEFNYVQADLKAKCHLHGRHTQVYRFAYYDKEKFKLYVNKLDGQMYRLNGEDMHLLPNGTDGVLFKYDPIYEPYEVSICDGNQHLEVFIVRRINFETSVLSVEEQRELFRVWMQSIFFESIMPTKPLLLFTGVKGSGKSSAGRMIGQLLFGPLYNVNSIAEERDFVAVVSNSYLPTFDNADSKKYWLQDRLAMAATGQVIELRKLYTTNEVERYYPRCFLILTSRTPQFKRDDVVERLLIFRLERLERFTAEKTLMQDIRENRDRIMSELFHMLNTCICRLKERELDEYSGNFRLADFADFGWKVSDDHQTFIDILHKMDAEQNEFLLEEDPFVECLTNWLDFEGNEGKTVTAGQLFQSLKNVADSEKIAFPYKSPRSLSMKLKHERSNLESFLRFEMENRKGYPNEYRFYRRREENLLV